MEKYLSFVINNRHLINKSGFFRTMCYNDAEIKLDDYAQQQNSLKTDCEDNKYTMDNKFTNFVDDGELDLSGFLSPEELAEIEYAAEKQFSSVKVIDKTEEPVIAPAAEEVDTEPCPAPAAASAAESKDIPAKKRPGFFGIIARILSFVLATVVIILGGALGVIYMLSYGPSESIRDLFVLSLRETSAAGFVAEIFLSEEEILLIEEANKPDDFLEQVDTSLISIAHKNEDGEKSEQTDDVAPIEIVDVSGSTFNGKMMIVSDPERVIVGVSQSLGIRGQLLDEMIAAYDGVGGTNAGGFDDPNGGGNGGIPLGVVIHEGKLLYGANTRAATMVIDHDGIMHVGNMTGNEAMALDAEWAVSFGPVLVVNGEKCDGLSSGLNPRTAIGQRSDGAMLLLVINGRQVGSMGATYEDVADVMLSFGAVNALNLDGGSSSTMLYEGEFLNISSSLVGQRGLPTGIIVLSEEDVK
ncbi:MAG: phosphodiester glycosidase family protein [Ruminococcaceae bacterium]|nr:phosphodiester glycosidase family protein [Oscillospiraceae bacterium]